MLLKGNVGVAVGVGSSNTIRVGVGRTEGVATGETSVAGGRRVGGAVVGVGVMRGEIDGGNGFSGVCGLMAMMMSPKIRPPVATSVKTVNIPGSRLTSAFLRLLPLHCSA